MKKLLIILISILTILALSSCDILELSAPEAETTEETSTDSEATTVEGTTNEDETYYGGSHVSCEYCGQLEGESRWFIARVAEDRMVHPLGNNCFEAKSAMDAGITLHYSEVDGDPDVKLKAGDVIKVEYNGMIMESYPVQISADKVTTVNLELSADLSKYLVSIGNLIVKSGQNQVCPLEGFVYSSSENLEADGAGIYFYLEAIFNGEITDEDMPVLNCNGELDVDLSGNNTLRVRYIVPSSKEETSCKLRQLSELDVGEYYVILEVDTKYGNSSYGYEYIFKLVIEPEELPTTSVNIKDYIKNDNNKTYLILPNSKKEIQVDSSELAYIYDIDVSLLSLAELKISLGGAVYLSFDQQNYLCLCCEDIVSIDPPNEIDGMTSGCNIDHKHVFKSYRITKEPCK